MFLQQERDVWDQLRQQKDLLANANELLSVRSVEVEDLHLGCADMKAEAGEASVPPPVQDLPPSYESAREVEVQTISSDDTSRGKEVADAEAASTVEQLVLTPTDGSSALVQVQPESHGWDHPRVLWRS